MYSSPLCGESAVYRNSLFEKGYSEIERERERETERGRKKEREKEGTIAEDGDH